MKKMKTLFKRDFTKRPALLLNEVNDGCDWVINGEGKATRKYDGCCCMIKDNILYKRREVKKGKEVPKGFIEADFDEITGKRVGWLKVDKNDPQDKWFTLAFPYKQVKKDGSEFIIDKLPNGTYELLGKGSQGDAENMGKPCLISHKNDVKIFENCPRTFEGLKEWLKDKDIEGIVFHHEDERMVKIKKRDFGLKRKEEKC